MAPLRLRRRSRQERGEDPRGLGAFPTQIFERATSAVAFLIPARPGGPDRWIPRAALARLCIVGIPFHGFRGIWQDCCGEIDEIDHAVTEAQLTHEVDDPTEQASRRGSAIERGRTAQARARQASRRSDVRRGETAGAQRQKLGPSKQVVRARTGYVGIIGICVFSVQSVQKAGRT